MVRRPRPPDVVDGRGGAPRWPRSVDIAEEITHLVAAAWALALSSPRQQQLRYLEQSCISGGEPLCWRARVAATRCADVSQVRERETSHRALSCTARLVLQADAGGLGLSARLVFGGAVPYLLILRLLEALKSVYKAVGRDSGARRIMIMIMIMIFFG